MYYNHNLRTNLQEWKSRLYKATYEQLGHQIKYCIHNIEKNRVLFNLIQEATLKYPYSQEQLSRIVEADYGRLEVSFEDEINHASYSYLILKYFIEECNSYSLQDYIFFQREDFEDTKKNIIEELFTPIFYYFHDKLEKSSSVIYLLEKYKKRTEWFTYNKLIEKYSTATKKYEQIFEDDLRLFLFDQGIDYPFSTPKSTSGRSDIVGSIETNDPLVIEVKIFDREKKYDKKRIIEGFSQIIKYTNDYNKDVGYLVIFNLDNAEINFDINEKNNIFPPMITFNNKTFFLITINLFKGITASKIGTTEVVIISENEMTK